MKIAIVGYGRMGKIIEKIAMERGHSICARLSETPTRENLGGAEVAIEFSKPEVAFDNVKSCIELGVPVVCGTTGWLTQKPEIEALTHAAEGAFLYGSNFSLGVNLFFALNERLAQLMEAQKEYTCQLEEIHHVHKKDAPSGTAITLAEGIVDNSVRYSYWKMNETKEDQLGIFAVRQDDVPGTHSVFYRSNVDEIEIKHTAHSREGFALGAVVAAEWIKNKKGVFSMRDVLGITY